MNADDAVIALGSNEYEEYADRAKALADALSDLERRGVPVRAASRIFRTPAFPPGSGGDFANAAALVDGALGPSGLLEMLHAVEADAGRVRGTRWGARVLDLDLLALGDRVLPDPGTFAHWRDLTPERQMVEAPGETILPHPRLQDRAFVLVPAMEVAADWVHPVFGMRMAALCAALPAARRAEAVATHVLRRGPGGWSAVPL